MDIVMIQKIWLQRYLQDCGNFFPLRDLNLVVRVSHVVWSLAEAFALLLGFQIVCCLAKKCFRSQTGFRG